MTTFSSENSSLPPTCAHVSVTSASPYSCAYDRLVCINVHVTSMHSCQCQVCAHVNDMRAHMSMSPAHYHAHMMWPTCLHECACDQHVPVVCACHWHVCALVNVTSTSPCSCACDWHSLKNVHMTSMHSWCQWQGCAHVNDTHVHMSMSPACHHGHAHVTDSLGLSCVFVPHLTLISSIRDDW